MMPKSIVPTVVAGVSLMLVPATVRAQAMPPDSRPQILKEIADSAEMAAKSGVVREPFATQVSPAQVNQMAIYLVALKRKTDESRALLKVMDARVDAQVAAAPAAGGGTSLASKGTVPAILGFAVENGALTKQVAGTTVTFRGNPTGIVKALQAKGLVDILEDFTQDPVAEFAAKWSFAASFDTSRGSPAGTLLANSQQLSSWSVRYEIHNARHAGSLDYANEWARLADTQEPTYGPTVTAVQGALAGWPEFVAWRGALVDRVRNEVEKPWQADKNTTAALARFSKILQKEFPKLEDLPNTPPAVIQALDAYVAEVAKVEKGIDTIYKFASKGQLATLDWTTKRDLNQPDLYTLTGVWERAFGKDRQNDLTVNGGISFYRTKPQGSEQFKNSDITAQYDKPLGRILIAPFVLTLAVKYQYIPNDTPASTADAAAAMASGATASAATASTAAFAAPLAPKGHLGIGQVKLTIPVKNGVKIPLSITVANRTELIPEKKIIRANFGVTFDFDALMAGASGGK